MRAKIILIALLLIVIAGLLVATPVGNNLFGNTNVLPGLTSLLDFGPKGYFPMQLVANKDAFIGKSFELSNTTLQLSGICTGSVYAFGANIAKEGKCTIFIEQAAGKVEYSSIGTIEASIDASQLSLDGSVIVPTNDKRVRFSVVPSELYIEIYKAYSVSLPAVTGEIKRFKLDGNEDQIKNLNNEKVEITNYIGNVRSSSNDMVLSGSATKVNWFS